MDGVNLQSLDPRKQEMLEARLVGSRVRIIYLFICNLVAAFLCKDHQHVGGLYCSGCPDILNVCSMPVIILDLGKTFVSGRL